MGLKDELKIAIANTARLDGKVPLSRKDLRDIYQDLCTIIDHYPKEEIRIPQPKIHVGTFDSGTTKTNSLYVSISPSGDFKWLNYKPELWLFKLRRRVRTRRKDRAAATSRYVKLTNKWVHPIDVNLRGSFIPTNYKLVVNKASIGLKHSEEPITITAPFQKQETVFDAYEYFNLAAGAPLTPGDFPIAPDQLRVAGSMKKGARSAWFYYCFVIVDPNDEKSKVYGPPSEVFNVHPLMDTLTIGNAIGLTINISMQSVNRKI